MTSDNPHPTAAPGRVKLGNPLFEGLTAGPLVLRLATGPDDIDAAQALRYRVFYEEMHAKPTTEGASRGRDIDPFDEICDHLLVVDTSLDEGPKSIVATYRLLRGSVARQHGPFYTAGEYDIACLFGYPGEMLELGRSCVDANYRNRPTMQLLWRGITDYVFYHDISLMFGCASLHGTEPETLALPLSYLYHFHLAPPGLRPRALPDLHVDMDFIAADDINQKKALAALPPLIKGYLRLNGFIGDGAVIDDQFNTTDVCIVVKTDLVTEKYIRHFTRNGDGA